MEVIQFKGKTISGISIRTTNANEMNPKTAKIGSLHQRFDQNITVDYPSGARVYGVYYNYESDANGEFSVLSGADAIQRTDIHLETITLPTGKYLRFNGAGAMPQAVIDVWGDICHIFHKKQRQKSVYLK